MVSSQFEDYYEALMVSPNADSDTIQRVFRHLAKRYHPDNPKTGNQRRFEVLLRAHEILGHTEARAAYDRDHAAYRAQRRDIVGAAGDETIVDDDAALRLRILTLLYAQRRRSTENPGLGDFRLSELLDIPYEHLTFHFWYLRGKAWIERLDDGCLAITPEGVDQVEQARQAAKNLPHRLLTDTQR
jgi:curved DNA-binding protein CbpA